MGQLLNTTEVLIFFYGHKDMSKFTANEIKSSLEHLGHAVLLLSLAGYSNTDCSGANHSGSINSDAACLNNGARYRIFLTVKDSDFSEKLPEYCNLVGPQSYEPQGYSMHKNEHDGTIDYIIVGSDEAGMMYGGFDFMKAVQKNGLRKVEDMIGRPFIKNRGIKFNIPLDARTPSYSDSGDSAQKNIINMWDMDFWAEFLDEMARNRFNVLSLWNLHPFPSMVKVPEYPNAALNDVKQTSTPLNNHLQGRDMSTPESLQNLSTIKIISIDEKISFWQDVMQYAQNRGIDVYIFTWNTFVYGTEDSGYGLTESIDDQITKDYFRKSVKALINTYPLLKGLGITSGENMSRNHDLDEAWLYDTYGQGINDALFEDPFREFVLIHRIQFASINTAITAFSGLNPRCSFETSFKYSQAHMYSSTRPNYINSDGNSYLTDIGDHKTWLTIRDDDYYMLRGGCDTEFIREYIKNMPCEKLQGYYMGPDGYTWGREYISLEPLQKNQQVIKKRWFCFMLWGVISYNPDTPDDDFLIALNRAYPEVNARNLFDAWSYASKIIPLVNRMHNKECQLDFQWYPEACCGKTGFHDVDRFIEVAPQDGEGIISIPDYAKAVLDHTDVYGTSPVDIAKQLWDNSCDALALTREIPPCEKKELLETVSDIQAMAYLGKYYSKKILGAVYKCMSDIDCEGVAKSQFKSMAKAHLLEASVCWRDYAALISEMYLPQTLTRLIPKDPALPRYIDIPSLQKEVDMDAELSTTPN